MRENSFISNFNLVVKGLLFIGIVTFVLKSTGDKYLEASSKNTINAFTKQRFDEFYEQDQNSIDMVFIGSSHSYCTFDPSIIDNALGTNSWQLGTPSQHPDTTYYLLKEVLNYQHPKTVVMEVYWDVCDDEFEPKQADNLFEVLENDKIRQEYIKYGFPIGEKAKYSIPAIRFQQDYFQYKGSEMEKELEEKYKVSKPWTAPANGVEYYQGKGYVYCDIIIDESEFDKTNQFKGLDGSKWDFDNNQKKYIEMIIELCKENDIELIFVTAPIANVSIDFITNYGVIHEKVSDLAKANETPYLDFNIINMEEKLLENHNFRDDAHLNHSGIEIVDEYFITWFLDNSELN